MRGREEGAGRDDEKGIKTACLQLRVLDELPENRQYVHSFVYPSLADLKM